MTQIAAVCYICVVILNKIITLQLSSPSEVNNGLLFSCPRDTQSIAAKKNNEITEFYDKTNADRNKASNRTVAELTTTLYDGWRRTFNENKEISREWISDQFSTLRSGDIIFESACGEGFNLAMTLQIINEVNGIENVTVYGNDYIGKSVEVAEDVLQKLAPSGSKIGSLCQGDSTNLYFVPTNTFDLAYTGYIEPIDDPIGVFHYATNPDDDSIGKDLCNAKKEGSDFEKVKLVDLNQKAQEDWYAKWILELIRIVKPGRLVIIENIALPICDDFNDWGGVSREWWKTAVTTYQWDVDVESILIKSVKPDSNRYHVSMRKNT